MLHLLVSTSAAPARKLDAAWPPVLEPPCGFLFFPCPPAEVQAPPSSPSKPPPQGKIQTIVAFPGTLQAAPYDFVAPYNDTAPPITDNKEITNYTLPPQAHEIAYNNVTHRVFFSNVPFGLMGEISLSQQKEKALDGSGVTFYQRWGSPVEGVVPGVDLSDDDDPNGWQHVGHFDRYTDHNLGNWLTDDRKINGLHNVGPSNHECVRPDNRRHPGALWLSEQYGDRVLLVDPSNMSAPPIYELQVPFDVHGPQVLGPQLGGEIFRSRLYNTPRFITMGPHAVHETPDCRIAVALKGPYDDGTVKVESECRDPKHVEMREGKAAYAWHRNLLADRHAPDHVNLAIVGHFSNSVLEVYRGVSLSQTSNQAGNDRAVRMDLVKSVLKAYQCARFEVNCDLDNDVESVNSGAKVLALIRAAFGSRTLTTPLRSFDANPTDAVETPPLLLRVLDATAAGLSLDRAADGGGQEQDEVLKFFFSFFPPTTFPEAMSSYEADNAEQVQQAIYEQNEHQYLKCTYESFQKAPFWLRRQICNRLALSNDIVFDYVCNSGCPRADDSGRGAGSQGSYDSYYSADTFQYATWVVDPNHYKQSAPAVMDGWPTVKQPSGYTAKGGLLYDTGAQPVQITTDREGNIYVAQDSTPSVLRIAKMDKFGRNMSEQINVGFGNKFGLPIDSGYAGEPPFQITGPGMVSSPDGSAWASSLKRKDGTILRFAQDGTPSPFTAFKVEQNNSTTALEEEGAKGACPMWPRPFIHLAFSNRSKMIYALASSLVPVNGSKVGPLNGNRAAVCEGVYMQQFRDDWSEPEEDVQYHFIPLNMSTGVDPNTNISSPGYVAAAGAPGLGTHRIITVDDCVDGINVFKVLVTGFTPAAIYEIDKSHFPRSSAQIAHRLVERIGLDSRAHRR